MFRFADPDYLYLLLAIPIFILMKIWNFRQRKKKLSKIGDPALVRQLMPDASYARPLLKFCILVIVFALFVIILSRPQFGTKISTEKRTGIETIIAIDVSNSMRAEDVAPSRLRRSKMMVENLVDKFSDDKIGLIVFAGQAFVQLPITSDYVSAKMFLGNIDPSMMQSQGTDIAEAINLASNSFTKQEGIGKAIIIITDGEDHEGGAIEAAKNAKENGMRVFVLGIGSTNGSPIPDPQTNDFMKDNTGNVVMSALNDEMCKSIAAAGGGAYIHVDNNSKAQEQLNSELSKLAKKEIESNIFSDYDEQFQAFAIIALVLIIIEICIMERKNKLMSRFSIFDRNRSAMLVLFMLANSLVAVAQTDRQLVREGNKLFNSGKFDEAEVAYLKALEKNNSNAQATYNLANAMFSQRKDSASVKQYEDALLKEKNPLRKSQAYHNIGVICQSHKMYGEAIEAYKNALRLNPNDDTTRYNLELCKRMNKNQQNQQNQDNKDQQGQDKDQKQDKKEQDKQEQNKQEQDKKEQDKQQNNAKDNKDNMSKENAEQLLKAALQKEKNTQERMQKAQQQQNPKMSDKNW